MVASKLSNLILSSAPSRGLTINLTPTTTITLGMFMLEVSTAMIQLKTPFMFLSTRGTRCYSHETPTIKYLTVLLSQLLPYLMVLNDRGLGISEPAGITAYRAPNWYGTPALAPSPR